jgi:hypothetical protein
VADENDRAALEPWLAQQDFEDIDGPVLERHGSSEPVGCRSFVSQSVDRNSIEVLGQPERPKRDILWRFSAPGVSAPSIVSVAAEAMDENDARSRCAGRTGDLNQSRHELELKPKNRSINTLQEPQPKSITFL